MFLPNPAPRIGSGTPADRQGFCVLPAWWAAALLTWVQPPAEDGEAGEQSDFQAVGLGEAESHRLHSALESCHLAGCSGSAQSAASVLFRLLFPLFGESQRRQRPQSVEPDYGNWLGQERNEEGRLQEKSVSVY